MPVRRHFLDWNAPVTTRVSQHLLATREATAGAMRAIDLSDTLIVAPTRHAGRRLSEALVQDAAARGLSLLNARVVTPTFFLQPETPNPRVAGDATAAAAWAQILQALAPDEAVALFPPAARRHDFDWALQSGTMIQSLRQELTEGAFTIEAVRRRFGDRLEEAARWEDLATLEARYHDTLHRMGLLDPIAARAAHARSGDRPPHIRHIVVASIPDPVLLLVDALNKAAETVEVDILVHAPPSLADAFDAWGRPIPEAWAAREIPIADPDRDLLLEASPQAQSERAVQRLRAEPPGTVAIGVPDPEVTPFLAAACSDAGLRAFDPADRPLSRHPLFTILAAFIDLAVEQSYRTFSALLRHADVLAALAADAGAPTSRQCLSELDEFQNAYLPATLDAVLEALGRTADRTSPPFPALRHAAHWLGAHLAAVQTPPGPQAIRAFLQAIYRARRLDPRSPTDSEFEAAAEQVDLVLRELEDAPPAALPRAPADLLALLRLRLSDARYHPIALRNDIDLEGWLELPWNDAPVLIVTGMNEGCVPDTRLRDPFLPDSLRALLGLRHDAARLARDACLMSAMIACRAATPGGRATFIVGKVGPSGDPLKPSRLLFRCPDPELPARARRLFGPAEAARPSVPSSISFRLNAAPPPDLPKNALPVSRLSVTSFRAYLACPFRFYLQSVLGMEPLDDSLTGLDPRDFGILTHAALQAMGESGMWRCDDEGTLRGYLDAEVDRWVQQRFGPRPPLAVVLAVEAAKQRLGAAARTQIALAADGWELMRTETKWTGRLAGLDLVGKIDRIDRHRRTGQWRIIDYKTSDKPTAPAEAHLAPTRDDTPPWMTLQADKPRRWIDLQLPLYVWLLRHGALADADAAPMPAEAWQHAEVAYFNLPKAVADTALTIWENFDAAVLDSATACAEEVARRIRANQFWPPSERVSFDNFETLLFDNPAAHILPPPLFTP